jgi:hypothetical protein
VGELDLGVDGFAPAGLDEGGESLAEQVVPLELGVREGHDLGEERVGAHEPVQVVAKALLLVIV